MQALPEEYISSICEIKTMENELVATGTISEITDTYLEIADKTGAMPLAEFDMVVKINVFNSRSGFRVLAGKVYTSSLRFIRIVEVTSLVDYERRHFFRVETNIPAQMQLRRPIRMEELEEAQAVDGDKYVSVMIKNLSLGGALLLSPIRLEEGEQVVLRIKLRHHYTHFVCTVRREELLPDGRPLYGCIFGDVPESESNVLCAFIFQRQREQIRQRRVERE